MDEYNRSMKYMLFLQPFAFWSTLNHRILTMHGVFSFCRMSDIKRQYIALLHNAGRRGLSRRTTRGAAVQMSRGSLSYMHLFLPLQAFETQGPYQQLRLGLNLCAVTRNSQETTCLQQCLPVTIHWYKTMAFRGTFASQEITDYLFVRTGVGSASE